jgi:hypothetical protein
VSTEAADSRYEQSRQDAKCDGGGRAFQQTTQHDGKAVATIAKPATTAAMWVKVEVIYLSCLRLAGIIIQNGPLPESKGTGGDGKGSVPRPRTEAPDAATSDMRRTRGLQ